jgi:hypothetical protein
MRSLFSEDEGLRRVKSGEIRRAAGGFVKANVKDRLGLVEKLSRFVEGAGLGLHRSMPSARMAYIRGMRGSL